MTTVREIIIQAYRKIGVRDPHSDEVSGGLDAFNGMVHGWRLEGIDVWQADTGLNEGFPMVGADIGDFDFASEFPMPAAFRDAAVHLLASRLATEFDAPVTWDDSRFMALLRAHYQNVPTSTIDQSIIDAGRSGWARIR